MELVTSGVRGFINKKINRDKNGEDFYRSAKKTLGKRIQKIFTEKTTWYRKRKASETEQTFVGLNANGLPAEPMRKRKGSEDGGQHHHHQVGGDTMAQEPRSPQQPHVEEGRVNGMNASKGLETIKKIKTGRV